MNKTDFEKDVNILKTEQSKLIFSYLDYNLENSWNSHLLINNLRKDVIGFVESKMQTSEMPFDPQDLEHQTLFFLTTYSPSEITQRVIEDVVEQQYLIICDRLFKTMSKEELDYLFRGLKLFYPDLNIKYRLKLKNSDNKILAVGDGRCFEVEFKKIEDQRIISCFTGGLHYIHQERVHGDAFAFYFKGDRYPWAIETTERSTFSRQYKRRALLAHGINPDNAIELTRLYTLPGSPINAVSMLDKMVKKYYQKQGDVEALFTCTMPSYSKSKSTTVSGGINEVLCIKDSSHYFYPRFIKGRQCWEFVTKRWLEENSINDSLRKTHADFKLLPVVDVFIKIKDINFDPLPELKNGKKVIYYSQAEQI